MTKKIAIADSIIKVVLSLSVVFSYFTNLIRGYFALALLILALITLVIFIARLIITMFLID